MTLSGGCACGAVRFTAEGAPRFAFICQCRDCQRLSGSGNAVQFCHDANRFEVTGDTAQWARDTQSGNQMTNHVCKICLSPLYSTTTRAPAIVMVLAGSLDDPAAITPDRIFYRDDAQPWDHIELPEKGS